jgi:hypothetical protein
MPDDLRLQYDSSEIVNPIFCASPPPVDTVGRTASSYCP